MLPEILAVLALVLVVGGAILYIVKAKKKGQKCIGCPYASVCTEKSACHEAEKKD